MKTDYQRAKAIVFEQPGRAAVKEIRLAEVDDETVVVRTKYSAISSGTEMAVYSGEGSGEGVWYPCVPGYEEVGEVVYVGPNAITSSTGERFQVGDRVMANEVRCYPDYCAAWGGQSGYAIKNPTTSPAPQDPPAKIPDNVSYQEAVVTYLACVAKKGLDMVGIHPGESVLVTGMGNIGLSALQLAKLCGAGRLIAADVRENRLRLAARYADATLNLSSPDAAENLLELNGGQKVDVVVECSGNPAAINPIPDYVRAGGRIHLQGQYRQPIVITGYGRWNDNDLRISCSIACNPGDKEAILKLISTGRFDAKSLYTKEYPVDDAPKAYEDLRRNRYDLLKVLFRWEE
ncbi:MAG: zinc-binding dehydrogenase [Anaerolineae bacterium]|nr:zinc-binding dehydrogenase [Anaerolineae bacterium]